MFPFKVLETERCLKALKAVFGECAQCGSVSFSSQVVGTKRSLWKRART
jgi:hypothetical protein